MFVYNKGKLVKNVIPISQDEFIFRLTHVTSGMTIEVKFNNESTVNLNFYKVYKEVEGRYVIYEEFYKKNKTIKENFEEAFKIDIFTKVKGLLIRSKELKDVIDEIKP